jgi:hypothetical protein
MMTWTLLLLLAAQSGKEPVPDPAGQKEVEKLLREVFKDDYGKKAPADRVLLAKKLLKQGSDASDGPATRYFTLCEAAELAASAGDVATALRAVDDLAKGFEVDPVKLKFAALTTAVKETRPPESMKAAATAFLALVDDALARDDVDAAEKAAAAASATARKAKDVATAARADAKAKELGDARQRLVKLKAAREALKANPDDPGANLEVGQHLCFVQGNWEEGLPLLAKGSQEALKAVAAKDLANPEATPDQIALADEWRDAAEKESGAPRQRLRERAATWYAKASGGATGLARVKIEKRLAELGVAVPKLAPAPKGAGPTEGLIGWWRLDEGSGDVAEDAAGGKHPGRIAGRPEWVDGPVGKALRFSGRGEIISVADAPELRVVGDLSVALWFRKDAQNSDWVRIFGKGPQGGTRTYGLWMGSVNQTNGQQHQFFWQQWGPSNQHVVVHLYSTTKPAVGVWTHVAVVVQGAQASIYVNGRKEGVQSRNGVPATGADPLTIGNAGYHESLVGALDDVRFYNRALTDEEVQKLASPK